MDIDSATEIEISRRSFSDVDLYSEWMREQGWEMESVQLTAGPNEIRYDSFALPELLVSHCGSKQSMKNVFTIPEGMVVFDICREKMPLLWCGAHLPPTLMGVVGSPREDLVVRPAGWDAYEFMVPHELIRRTEIFPRWFLEETADLDRAFLPLREPVTGQFLQQLDSYFHEARKVNGSPGVAPQRGEFLDFLIDGLQLLIDAGLRSRGSARPRSARRLDLVTRAKDFVSTHLTADFSADDLARALDVSYRVFNYAFRDSLGMSPYQYILTQKLHAVRRQLKSNVVSVTEACISHGFYSPGRFARQYARLFGELPSETISANGRRAG